MNWRVPLADLDLGDEEAEAVQEVLRSRWLTMGSKTQQFEEEFCAFTSAQYALAVTNCTAGLHMACAALGIGPGDEVIVPSLSFVATSNCVRYCGATPVFADITSSDDLTLSPASIESCITPQTRAVIIMHYAGYACDLERILSITQKHGLYLIEDAAHAAGSTYQGRALGTWGDIGCYSFFSNKNMTTGEGGMVVTQDAALSDQLRLLRSHGMTSLTWDRHRGHAWSYDVVNLGYNYRIDEIRAAIGIVQLHKLDQNNLRRRELTNLYHNLMQEITPGVHLPFIHFRGQSACHILPILLPEECDRLRVMERMREEGVQTSIHYPPTHQFSAYRHNALAVALPITEMAASRQMTLPLFPTMTDEQVALVVESLQVALTQKE